MIAGFTKTPEIALEKDDANRLAKAMAEVAVYYPANIDPKTLAWVNLLMAAGTVYGPMVFLVAERRRAERAANVTAEATHTFMEPTLHPAGAPAPVQVAPAASQDGTANAAGLWKPPPGVTFPGM